LIQGIYKVEVQLILMVAAFLFMNLLQDVSAASEESAALSHFQLPPGATLQRLESGEVIVEVQARSEKGASVIAWILINAPVARIWETIISCEQAQYFVAGLKFCEVLEETGDYALTRQVVDKGWSTPRLDYTFATRRIPFQSMTFELASGNLGKLSGDWSFESIAGGVLLRHRIELRPLVPFPRWLVRRNLRKDLPAMLKCIRGLVSGSGSSESVTRERAQCPGGSA